MKLQSLILGTTILGIAACGSDNVTPPDARVDAAVDAPAQIDAAPDSGASCDSVVQLNIPSGMTSATYMGDNSMGMAMLDPMTPGCGATPTGPEIVHHLHIPGTGMFQLTATTVDMATTADTIVYVQTQCGAGTELGCNDDTAFGVAASTTAVPVMGGQDVFIIVDSYILQGNTLAGPYKLTVSVKPMRGMGENCDPTRMADVCAAGLTCTPPGGTTHTCQTGVAPTLSKAEMLLSDGSTTDGWLYVTGTDPDADIVAVNLTFKDAGGQMVDMFGVAGPTTVSFTAFPLPASLSTFNGDAATIDVQLLDSVGHTSSTINVTPITPKNITQACNPAVDAPDECHHDLVCTGSVCAIGAAEAAACGAATLVTSGTPVNDMLSATGTDLFEGSCFYIPGFAEKVYKVVVPPPTAGQTAHDVVASTFDSATTYDRMTMADTYVYIRSTCGDPATEKACNDDVGMPQNDFRSTATAQNLAAGTYFIFVDDAGFVPSGTFKLTVTVRPVLMAGQTCDPMGIMNRCANGACPAAGTCP